MKEELEVLLKTVLGVAEDNRKQLNEPFGQLAGMDKWLKGNVSGLEAAGQLIKELMENLERE